MTDQTPNTEDGVEVIRDGKDVTVFVPTIHVFIHPEQEADR